jgi:hypothetical protein
MLSAHSVLKHSDDVIAQTIKSETILFDVTGGEYYSLNELGARTWELLDGSRSVGSLVEILTAEYDAPTKTIEKDVVTLLEDLVRGKLLLQVGS